MIIGKYIFTCRLTSNAELPPFKGSTVRGVFGNALKKVVCALKKNECLTCLLREQCLYSLVFETPDSIKPQSVTRVVSPPHPFVIEPPATNRTKFDEGEQLDFTLLLFGAYNQKLPYFIYAFEQMGRIGIGRKINGKRAQFDLLYVTHGKDTIYTVGNDTISIPDTFLEINADYFEKKQICSEPSSIILCLDTPLRLKYNNGYIAELPFHVLVRAMLRRASSIFSCYDGGEPPLDYKALVHQSKDIRNIHSNLQWMDWKRYSHRQDQSMMMGGIVGTVQYEGPIEAYIPLIEFSIIAHLGKQTSFGLGKISLTETIN